MNPFLKLFEMQRSIFGVCPNSGEIFRLSDCQIYIKSRPKADWLDRFEAEGAKVEAAQDRLDNDREKIKEAARIKGRQAAEKAIRAVDRIFRPKRLNPDDAKVIFHPIDFVVFDGKTDKRVEKLILLDRRTRPSDEQRQAQKSVAQAVEKERYEWLTLRVGEDGTIEAEK
ncbi:MAG: hypothetical protein KIT79_00935 [Deltaproteobacteria bacterium]|nr:hypothetical protein [Deltaproteobacteria bacterium]